MMRHNWSWTAPATRRVFSAPPLDSQTPHTHGRGLLWQTSLLQRTVAHPFGTRQLPRHTCLFAQELTQARSPQISYPSRWFFGFDRAPDRIGARRGSANPDGSL